MKDISDAEDLMATARAALLNELLPALPNDRRYAALMIANAMAIAAREHRSGPDAARGEAGRLHHLLTAIGHCERPESGASETELPALRRALCAAVRSGNFDADPHRPVLVAHLARTAADWVAISNPKAL